MLPRLHLEETRWEGLFFWGSVLESLRGIREPLDNSLIIHYWVPKHPAILLWQWNKWSISILSPREFFMSTGRASEADCCRRRDLLSYRNTSDEPRCRKLKEFCRNSEGNHKQLLNDFSWGHSSLFFLSTLNSHHDIYSTAEKKFTNVSSLADPSLAPWLWSWGDQRSKSHHQHDHHLDPVGFWQVGGCWSAHQQVI